MQTLVVNNQKGGVGKTVLTCHLAWFLKEAPGARVAVLDFDPQGNASKVLADAHSGGVSSALFFDPDFAPAEGLPGITVFKADGKLVGVNGDHVPQMAERFATLQDRFDYAIIDTPPSWGWCNLAALMVTDHLISPIDLEMFALDGVQALRRNVASVEKGPRQGRPINFLGLLASRFQSNSPRQKGNLKSLFESAGALMFEGVVTQRQGYAEAMVESEPVWSLKSTAAREAGKEIRSILERVKTRMDQQRQEQAA